MQQIILTLISIVILAVPISGYLLFQQSLPKLDGVIESNDLKGKASIKTDTRKIPYIEAETESDLYYLQGYNMAANRLFQMDMLRRTAEGRLSEVFGIDCLSQDKLMRTVGISRRAEVETKMLSENSQNMLASFCDGVNFYIKEYKEKLPLEFRLLGYEPESWQPIDTLAIMKLVDYLADESWHLDDLRQRIAEKVGSEQEAILFADNFSPGLLSKIDSHKALDQSNQENTNNEDRHGSAMPLQALPQIKIKVRPNWGSSAWVVSGKLTENGNALLACAKDQTLLTPDLFYLCSLSTKNLHVTGATVAGVPGITIGRNDYISWASTSLKADVQDLMLEEFSSKFPDQYLTSNGPKTAGIIKEIISVRFGPKILHRVLTTNHGPILIKNKTKAIALSWTGNINSKSNLDTIYKLNHAEDWQQFSEAIGNYQGSPQIFLYTDQKGNIGYHAAGFIPVRKSPGNGTGITVGFQDAGQWISNVQFNDLPFAYNPECGYLVAANQKPSQLAQNVIVGHQWGSPYRARRINSHLAYLVSSKHKINLLDMNDLQADQLSLLAPLIKKELGSSIQDTQLIDHFELSAYQLLQKWDGTLKPDSAAAAIYESFLHAFANRLLNAKLGFDLTEEYMERFPSWTSLVERCIIDKPANWLPPEERSYQTFMITSFSKALKNLRIKFHSDDPNKWTWQSIHLATLKHPISTHIASLSPLFDIGPIGVGGDSDVINAFSTSNFNQGNYNCDFGPTLRLIMDQSDKDKFYGTISTGESGQTFSQFNKDQLSSWLSVDPLPIASSSQQLDKMTQHTLFFTGE